MDAATSNSTNNNNSSNAITATSIAAVPPNTVFVSMPQHGAIIPAGSKAAQSVIQQNQASVIQSTALQTVQVGKGGVLLFKGSPNSVIQSASGQHSLQEVHVVSAESGDDLDTGRKQQRQILVRRPSYRKILNDLGGTELSDRNEGGGGVGSSGGDGCHESSLPTTTLTIGGQEYSTASLLKVIPASSLQLATSGADALQTLAMSSASSQGTIVQYTGSDTQFIVPVGGGTLSGLKFSDGSGLTQGVVLAAAAAAPTTTSNSLHGTDAMGEEANRKREVRLMKNREAARECRAKKKEYIKCLENRVAVLENQNKALIEELKTLKALYCQSS
ncbi:cyclic AMP-dependent transcription factor ATF-1 [Hyalella azteca]|uniref:Cyclic AMP-dependent transcription factor ATF-1 n=1 Tax=Hyalella azteca TaxID=294128 RepID=A0A8B7P7N0_HYAAZ|nr:cyclic AMP-dependent transcription factor ATF-1 [Hyalella azteca]